MKEKCFAKLNLYLKVFEKKDNFHNIETVFLKTYDIYDEIEVIPSIENTIERKIGKLSLLQSEKFQKNITSHLEKLNSENDITLKVLKEFQKRFSLPCQSVILEKNIPFQGGLGGSSADGVGIAFLLAKTYNIPINDWFDILEKYGSDLSAMSLGSVVKGVGRGTICEKICDNLGKFAVVAFDGYNLSTKDVFEQFDILEGKNTYEEIDIFDKDIMKNMVNHLEKSAFTLSEKILEYKNKLEKITFKKFLMTGSGSAFFTIVDDIQEAEEIKKQISKFSIFVAITRV